MTRTPLEILLSQKAHWSTEDEWIKSVYNTGALDALDAAMGRITDKELVQAIGPLPYGLDAAEWVE